MIWRTDKPTEKVIVAQLSANFCGGKERYVVLYLTTKPYVHYHEYGEEVPCSAIEKWASLEQEESVDKDLEDFAYQCAYDLSNDWLKENATWDDVMVACKYGAAWQKQRVFKAMDLGVPPYLISVEQAYYNVKKILNE